MKSRFNFTFSGLIIALILVAMFATVFGLMMGEMSTNYGITDPESFSKYEEYTTELQYLSENISSATDHKQDEGLLDILGGYFSAGYSALKTTEVSLNLVTEMGEDMSEDVDGFQHIKNYLVLIIFIALLIGVVIAVLVKMRI